jgi:hypothetical protein
MAEAQSTATQTAESLKSASQQAGEWASEAARKSRSAFSEQCRSTANGLTETADAMHRAARDLEGHQNTVAARLVGSAGDYLASAAARLREKDLNELMTDATNAARRNPWAFFAGSVAVGAVLARFLKSSSPTSSASHAELHSQSKFYPPARTSDSSTYQPAHGTGGSDGNP